MQQEAVCNQQHFLGEDLMLKTIEVVSWRTLSHCVEIMRQIKHYILWRLSLLNLMILRLYNMAGNVSEWVNASYDPSSYESYVNYESKCKRCNNQRKVVRGGSWKDVAYFLQVSVVISNMQILQEVILVSVQFKITWGLM